ncbi:hypothetical protein [Weissella sp. MSCH1]|uniref:hypothetical protein n=1 Tax=Weissella sp. MSCH1 TaxID=3383343 RepID=UPI0038969A0D
MAFFIDAKEILNEFQMTVPVTVIKTGEQSYDPILPKNKASLASPALSQFIQDAGGWDGIDRAVWYTTTTVPLGEFLMFNETRWRITSVDDYDATTFSNFYVYGLQAADSLQRKDIDDNDEYWK